MLPWILGAAAAAAGAYYLFGSPSSKQGPTPATPKASPKAAPPAYRPAPSAPYTPPGAPPMPSYVPPTPTAPAAVVIPIPTIEPIPGIPAVAQPDMAMVTTNDPAPAGDLIIRDKPNGTQIGGAEKNGLVQVLDWGSDGWSKIAWGGGARRPAATGWAHTAYLKPAS